MSREDKLTQSEALERTRRIELSHTEVFLHLKKGNREYSGEVHFSFHLKAAGPLPELDCAVSRVLATEINGRAVPFQVEKKRLIVSGEYPVSDLELKITFEGRASKNGLGMHYFRDPEDQRDYFYTDLEPYECHSVFPCWDQPDMKAPLQLRARLPKDWFFSSNEPVSRIEVMEDEQVVLFERTPPMSPYVFCLVTGDYAVISGQNTPVPMRVLVRHSLRKYCDPEFMMELASRAMDWMETEFQTPFPYRHYDQAFVPEYTMGAMENPGIVTFNELYLFREKPSRREKMNFANTVVHELAHMWFGNLVTMRWWGDLWLNESFATFTPYLCLKEMGDYPDCMEVFLDEVISSALNEDENSTSHPIIADCPNTQFAQLNFDAITYEKGACVLFQLIHRIGRGKYREAVKLYLERHRFKVTDWRDWLAVLGEVTDLKTDEFARDFWHSRGLNQHSLVRKGDELVLVQKPDCHEGLLRHQKVMVRLYVQGKENVPEFSEWDGILDSKETSLGKIPEGFLFALPNIGGFGLGRFHLSEKCLKNACVSYRNLDIHERHGLLSAMQSMLECEEADPGLLMDFVLEALGQETEPVLEEMLNDLMRMLAFWVFPKSQEEECYARIQKALIPYARSFEEGSDRLRRVRNMLVDTLIPAFGVEKIQAAFFVGNLHGLVLEKSNFKTLAARLCALRHEDSEKVIQTVGEKLSGEDGQKYQHYLKSLLRHDKDALLQEILVPGRKESVEWIGYEMRSLFSRLQRNENQSLVKSWFEAQPDLWKKRDKTFLNDLMQLSFPYCHEGMALELSSEILSREGIDVALIRRLKETSERLLRYRRIRLRYFGLEE